MSNNLISIVIPAFNEEKNISACLDSLAAQKTAYIFEVIVVDNNSTDKTAAIAAQFQSRLNLRIIAEPRQGRGAARARGFEQAKGQIILSTDADAVASSDWVENIVDALNRDVSPAATGAVAIYDLPGWKQNFFNWFWPKFSWSYKILFRHYCLSGFNFGIYRDVYQQAGGFNPNLTGMEDLDLSFKVKKISRIVYVPNAKVVFSGRRFKHGLWGGLLEYVYEFFRYFLSGKKIGKLRDVRF